MPDLIDRALSEDVGDGDLTTRAVVLPGARARARIEQRAAAFPAGLRVAETVFQRLDSGLRWRAHAVGGKWREPGPLAEIVGDAAAILARRARRAQLPRPAVGNRDLTARYVRAVDGTGVRILDTRKTTPGMRVLEKEAVRAGRRINHRAGLHDAILVKENHAALAGGVGRRPARALADAPPGVSVEVESPRSPMWRRRSRPVSRGCCWTTCRRTELRRAVELVDGRAELEASGGITLDNVRAIAETGVDFISIGALTHSAPALDVSLLLEPL